MRSVSSRRHTAVGCQFSLENRRRRMSTMEQIVVCHWCDAGITVSGIWPMNPPQAEPEMSALGLLEDSAGDPPNCSMVRERPPMRGLKFLLSAAALLAPLALVPRTNAQVTINIGTPPMCSYGYYGYAPYACAPPGYYGPGYFYNGIFLGIGPWENWGYRHGWGGHRFQGSGGGRYHGSRGYSGGGGSARTRGHAEGYRSGPGNRNGGPSRNHGHSQAAHRGGGSSHNNRGHGQAAHGNGDGSHGNGGGQRH